MAILGAGPAGLMLARLLELAGIESVVLESRTRDHVEKRIRAGVLEHGSAQLLRAAGVGGRMDREGLLHDGIHLQFAGERHRIDFQDLLGRGIVVYGQQEVVKDLIATRDRAGGRLYFESEAIAIDTGTPAVRFRRDGSEDLLKCDFVAACDGSHGIGRRLLEERGVPRYEREYGHAWLGVLARTPPSETELVYAYHEHGFALHSMRSPEVSRLYLQVSPRADLKEWPEDRIWTELRMRLGEPELQSGEILEIGITPMRSVVLEPMQADRVFLCGDSAHIVPPTGAKGMNLALGDVSVLSKALEAWYSGAGETLLGRYSEDCSRRVWRAQGFSNQMTRLLHSTSGDDAFERRLRLSNLRELTRSRAAATAFAENYTGAATDGIA